VKEERLKVLIKEADELTAISQQPAKLSKQTIENPNKMNPKSPIQNPTSGNCDQNHQSIPELP
jgi:hypothetical protein